MSHRPLTARHAAFVREYMVDGNATQACIRAGYSATNADVTGPRLLGNVGIQRAITVARERAEEEAGATRVWALRRLFETAERCLQAFPVLDSRGRPVPGQYQFREMGAVAAIDKIARMQGWYAPSKRELSGPDGGPIEMAAGTWNLEALSTEELLQLRAMSEKASAPTLNP